jgi:hypothetical protein
MFVRVDKDAKTTAFSSQSVVFEDKIAMSVSRRSITFGSNGSYIQEVSLCEEIVIDAVMGGLGASSGETTDEVGTRWIESPTHYRGGLP